MKTFKLLCPPSSPAGLATLIIIITAAFLTGSAFAGSITPTASLVLTENSSTDLSLTYNGPDAQPGLFTVTNTSPDNWTIQVTGGLGPVSFIQFTHDWAEPEDPTNAFINEVSNPAAIPAGQSGMLFVRSDLSILQDVNGLGGISPDNTSFLVGLDSSVPIYLTFHDLAASSEAGGVPETGSTIVLLILSAVALCGANRFGQVRRA